MAGKGATLAIRIISDASKASEGFDKAESRVGGFTKNLDRASVAAAGALAGIAALSKEAFDSASRLEQAGGAVESVFGAQAAAVDKLAKDAAQRVGLATASYSELASVLGSQLQNMGFHGDALVAKQEELIKTGADLAATFGGETSQAVEALSSLLRGERDPIERYGIAINQAAVDSKVAALGLDTSTDAAKRSAQAQATLALVAAQSANAHGAFAREADTAAGAQQRASAEFENAKAALGQSLLPVVSEAAGIFAGFSTGLTEHTQAVTVVTLAVAGLAAGVLLVNGVVKAYEAAVVVAEAVTWAWNAALDANPLVLIVLAIAALVAAVVIAYQKFEWFRDIVKSVWEWLKKAFDFVSGGWVDNAVASVFGAPLSANVAHGWAGPVAGLYGAASSPAPAPMYGAALSAGMAAGNTPAPSASSGPSQVINVTINGAVDKVGTGRTVDRVMRKYGQATGSRTVARGGWT